MPQVRERIRLQLNSTSLAERLVPVQPLEDEARQRAELLLATFGDRLASPQLAGSGPFGTLTPADAASLMQGMQVTNQCCCHSQISFI